ncbi:hypothetical protein HDE_01545 [Halotydeus destructor]|nr:hypothetical protein HDE_01545 [Halotydeus destructor]
MSITITKSSSKCLAASSSALNTEARCWSNLNSESSTDYQDDDQDSGIGTTSTPLQSSLATLSSSASPQLFTVARLTINFKQTVINSSTTLYISLRNTSSSTVQVYTVNCVPSFEECHISCPWSHLLVNVLPGHSVSLPVIWEPKQDGDLCEQIVLCRNDGTLFEVLLLGTCRWRCRSQLLSLPLKKNKLWSTAKVKASFTRLKEAAIVIQVSWRRFLMRKAVSDKWHSLIAQLKSVQVPPVIKEQRPLSLQSTRTRVIRGAALKRQSPTSSAVCQAEPKVKRRRVPPPSVAAGDTIKGRVVEHSSTPDVPDSGQVAFAALLCEDDPCRCVACDNAIYVAAGVKILYWYRRTKEANEKRRQFLALKTATVYIQRLYRKQTIWRKWSRVADDLRHEQRKTMAAVVIQTSWRLYRERQSRKLSPPNRMCSSAKTAAILSACALLAYAGYRIYRTISK